MDLIEILILSHVKAGRRLTGLLWQENLKNQSNKEKQMTAIFAGASLAHVDRL